MILEKGRILSNRYEIIEQAGRGGMAEVYKARDFESGEIVAIKALKPEFNDDDEFVKRFDLEARAAASLSHPNIVNVYGVGEDRNIRYIVQEYIEGRSLKEELQDKGKLDWRIAVPVVIQIALALEHAHSQSIIHRDIKPANILITEDGVCIVTDFGIARAVNANTVTMTGSNALGSVHYFSPEQARGGIVDHRSDIYSLGILLYELVTGQAPYNADTSVAIALQHLQEQATLPTELEPSIPKGLEDIILRCIAKNPDDRYENSRALIDDLDNFMINPNSRYGRRRQVQEQVSAATPGPTVTGSVQDGQSLQKVIDLEDSIGSRRRSRNVDAIITVIVIVLLAVLLLGFGVWFIADRFGSDFGIVDQNDDNYIMENFIGQEYDSVASLLRGEGVNHIALEEASETVEPGQIIAQNFPVGTSINKAGTFVRGSEIILTVSTGSEFSIVPNVAGQSIDAAVSTLENEYGLTVLVRDEFSISAPEGAVLSISPEAGTQVGRGSRVTLTVSKGRNTGPLPDVTGQRISDAANYLNSIGFNTEIQIPNYLRGEEANLYVIEMSPAAGSSNVSGAVILRAGTYEEAHPTPTPEPTTTEETTTEETTTEPTTEETTTAQSTAAPTETTTTPTTAAPTETTTVPTTAPPAND